MSAKLPLLLGPMVVLLAVSLASAQKKEPTPHGQDRPPGPALTPAEALKKMTVPEGFHVELVASEPNLINPVAMTFDERGRIWITESLEYPRREAGPGRDRVKVLESTRGDGKYDKITIFAEGLNIPSGIAVGHGGVWVANAPDILFYKEGPDGKAAGKPEVVVTGFGRTDTHELPNSLVWGPDGWLYGLNGVFNYSHVKQNGKEWKFTCALFRIHPRTREFQLFCEGTSNPWGVALDTEGSFFVSACVIDHLWHLVETGYYHRQGGPYPPFTWKLGSIVKHKHQKAAYCGLHYFDSDAYPPEYREKLYMGNIHGGCINSDELTRDGSTYFAKPRPDFLSANDQWFMPVSQKTGPDGCLYVLDWYDRYHCYQDANRDPKGIDRLNGRLYRVVYKDYKAPGKFDLGKETDLQLTERLSSPNVYFRDAAQRVLTQRLAEQGQKGGDPLLRWSDLPRNGAVGPSSLARLVLDEKLPRKARLHALWVLVGANLVEAPLSTDGTLFDALLKHKDPTFRAWAVRAAGNAQQGPNTDKEVVAAKKVVALVSDPSPDVRLQVAIAAPKMLKEKALPVLVEVLRAGGDDRVIPVIVWQNLYPLLEDHAEEFLKLAAADLSKNPNLDKLLPRAVERVLARKKVEPALVVALLDLLLNGSSSEVGAARQCLDLLAGKIQTEELHAEQLSALGEKLLPRLKPLLEKEGSPLHLDAALLAASLKEPAGIVIARRLFSQSGDETRRLRALEALVSARDAGLLKAVGPVLTDGKAGSSNFRGQVLSALGRLDEPAVAAVVLEAFPRLEPSLQPRAIELLTQRPAWGKELLDAMAKKKVPATMLNVNHARRLNGSKDPAILKLVRDLWGTVREDRNPAREKVVEEMRALLNRTPGDPLKGMQVFKTVCGQCHKIHGEGQDVGPDITANGRASFDQLLSNVFDPSLVIVAAYQATNVTTTRGRTVTGLLVEDSPQRLVLKGQGGKVETIARDDVEEVHVSKVSLMPEGVENQLKPQEIADLFAFLVLEKPPGDPSGRKIPGSPR